VTAEARPDGTVQVGWTAPGGQVTGYQIVATSANLAPKTWPADGAQTSFTVPAGVLAYGDQVAFTVAAVDAQGGSSPPSALSNSVTPFTKPSAPLNPRMRALEAGRGVEVAWDEPASNGTPITKYVVAYAGGGKDVVGATTTQLTDLPAGAGVTVVAHNAAGASDPAGPVTLSPVANPTITITGQTVGYNFVTVAFAFEGGGGTPRCGLTIAGMSNVVEANCDSKSLTYPGLAPGVQYNATVTVTNNAGGRAEAPVQFTTNELRGTVHCKSTNGYCDSGIGIYSKPMQDTSVRTGKVGLDGNTFRANCKVEGRDGNLSRDAELFAAQYNNNKRSTFWIKIDNVEQYIPYVWFNLDAGDNLDNLPLCP
jgi:hypothetical protein